MNNKLIVLLCTLIAFCSLGTVLAAVALVSLLVSGDPTFGGGWQ
ncbi:hypothetical protein [Aeromonas dhakensis]|nr:hypothetical protein [Aeromonas dhakensis]